MLSSDLIRSDDEVSHVLLEQERGLGVGELLQGKSLRQQRTDFLALDVADQGFEYSYRHDGGAEQRQIFEIEGSQVQIHHRPGYGARGHIAVIDIEVGEGVARGE